MVAGIVISLTIGLVRILVAAFTKLVSRRRKRINGYRRMDLMVFT